MIYLLDTHYMLWGIADSKKLSAKLKTTIQNPENTILVSTISFWEVSLKVSIGKLEIKGFTPEDLPKACLDTRFKIVMPGAEECSTYHHLKLVSHKDPFDRMLVCQAIKNNYVLISRDEKVNQYASEGLKIWKD